MSTQQWTASRQPLGLDLVARTDEFAALLLTAPSEGVPASGRAWLADRYREIVPLVLPAALTSVETGEPLDPEAVDALRRAAVRAAGEPAPGLSTVLRGAVPALAVFGRVIQVGGGHLTPETAALAVSRAASVAHELGCCWAEAWSARIAGDQPTSAGSPTAPLTLVVDGPDLEEADEQMLRLAAYGLSNQDIADRTSYSRQAVGWRLSRMMRSWNVPNRAALVTAAFLRGVMRLRVARRSGRDRAIEP